jgi:hypothetical protein
MSRRRALIGILSATAFVASLAVQLVPPHAASAAQITNRSLTLQVGAGGDGGSKPSGVVNHLFNFSLPSTNSLGSIKFQYCTTAAPVAGGIGCNLPTGTDTTTATLGNEAGVTGFSISSGAPNGTVILSRTASTISAGAVSYRLDGVVNPNTAQTFFVRISTYGSTDGTGSSIDTGTVAAATSTQIQLTGTMPESLVFCAGAAVNTTAGVPDCSTVTTGAVSFDRLFSPTDTALATSQMAASTNATSGYAITVNGPTMTSGSNTINAMATTDTSKHGISQFGTALVLNDGTAYIGAPVISGITGEPNSANVAPASNGTNYRGQPQTGYGTAGSFTYNNNQTVADSGFNTLGGTDAQIFTNSYIVNVPGSQPAGTYTTTLTYICTPTF